MKAMKDLMPMLNALKDSDDLVTHTDLYAQADRALVQWKATAKTCEKRIRESRATGSVKKDKKDKKDPGKKDKGKPKKDISDEDEDEEES